MYIAQAFKGLYQWWRYLVGSVIIFVASAIGQIPYVVVVQLRPILQTAVKKTGLVKPLPIDLNLNLFLLLLSSVVGFIAILLVNKYLHNMSIPQLVTSRKTIDWRRFWFMFLTWSVISVGVFFVNYLIHPEDYVLQFNLKPFIVLCVIVFAFIPLQTSFEELFFRGYLMQGIGVIYKRQWVPLMITSVVFGMMHLSNPEIAKMGRVLLIYYIGVGLFLGVITLMDEGLELSLGFHAANNVFTALLVTANWTAFRVPSIFKDVSNPLQSEILEMAIALCIIFPTLLLVLSKKYHWVYWKRRLFGRVIVPSKDQTP